MASHILKQHPQEIIFFFKIIFSFCLCKICLVQTQYHPRFLLKLLVTIKIGEIVISIAIVVIIIAIGSVGEFSSSKCSSLSSTVLMSLSTLAEIEKRGKTKVQGTGKHSKILRLRQIPKFTVSMRTLPATGQDFTLLVFPAI